MTPPTGKIHSRPTRQRHDPHDLPHHVRAFHLLAMALLEDLLVTLLWGTKATLTHPGILLPSSESTSDTELKNIVKQTQRVQESRYVLSLVCSLSKSFSRETLGHSPKVWKTLTETLRAGNEQLIANKHHLLPKIWDITILGRNLLAAKEKAQNLAAYTCRLVSLFRKLRTEPK